MRAIGVIGLILWMALLPLVAQQPTASGNATGTIAAPVLYADVEPITEYPSMLPVLQIRVNLNTDGKVDMRISGIVNKALASKPAWDCKATSSYDVEDTTSHKRVAIANIRLEGDAQSCTIGSGPIASHPAVVLVLREGQVMKEDKLTVSLANLPTPLTVSVSATMSPSDPVFKALPSIFYALTITPQAAPSEALTTGVKRDTGQLAISYTNPEVAPWFHSAAVFVSSTDLFSTDERDAMSAFSGTIGLKRGLLAHWYVPGSIQQTLQGNQVATNLSAVTSGSVAFLVPPRWTRALLYNETIQAPNPPELTIKASYTHRIAQVATKSTSLLSVDDFSLNPSATFAPVYVFPKICSAYQKHIRGTTAKDASTSKQYCLALQTDLGMWYLPLDTTKAGSQRAEGYGDVSFLIPLSDIPFASSKITNIIMGASTNAQLHIKFSDAVNAANNFARTRQWTFAFDVIK